MRSVYKKTSVIIFNKIVTTNYHLPVLSINHLQYSKMATVKVNPRIGVCQFTATSNKEENFSTCKSLIEKSAALGAKVIFLPEACDYIAETIQSSVDMAESLDGPILTQFKQLAQSNNVWLSAGFHIKSKSDENRVYNSHVMINSEGVITAVYNKAHLFDLDIKNTVKLTESSFTIPGSHIIEPIQTPVGRLGLATCYDLRFPEMAITLRQQGAEILTYPSVFTQTTGLAHWEPLLRSRAIENQCYVVAAAQIGKHNNKRTSYGHSMVVDPWGTVIAQCKDGTDVCLAEIDHEYLYKIRQDMPVQSHKRTDLYSPINTFITGNIDDRDCYEFGQYQVKSTQVFIKTGLSYGFVNIKPVLPGHLLVAPIRKVEKISKMTAEETSDLFNTTRRISEVCQKHFKGTALTIAIQDGVDAGQSVEHVHVHILPRKPGDFEKNDSIYDEIITDLKLAADPQTKKSRHHYYLLSKFELLLCGDIEKLIKKRQSPEESAK